MERAPDERVPKRTRRLDVIVLTIADTEPIVQLWRSVRIVITSQATHSTTDLMELTKLIEGHIEFF